MRKLFYRLEKRQLHRKVAKMQVFEVFLQPRYLAMARNHYICGEER